MQGLTMIAVSVAIIIQGCVEAGGVDTVIETNKEGGRLEFFKFDWDPTIRVTTNSALIGQLFMSLSILGCQQNFVQRYCSMGSQKKVTKTLMFNIPVITILFSLSWVVGMVVYAVYVNCDPYKAGYIQKYDEILPFFVEDRFNYLPGVLGLFMACLFNGALSLNVSNLNSLATVTFEDFLKPIPRLKALKDIHQLYVIKAIGIVYGFVIMGISFGVGLLSGVIESSMLVTSATTGPLLGVFLLALLVPCCNWKGASVGIIVSHLVTLWITFGGLTIDKPVREMPLSIEGCNNESFTSHILRPDIPLPILTAPIPIITTYSASSLNITRAETSDPLMQLYSVTYMYYSLIGCIITVVLGWAISCITGFSEDELYAENLLHPIAQKMSNCFPGAKRRYLEDRKLSTREESIHEVANGSIKHETKFGTSNPNFIQDSPIEEVEVFKTKL